MGASGLQVVILVIAAVASLVAVWFAAKRDRTDW